LALGKPKAPVQTLENLEMKKTLVAVAALAAATGAFAQNSVSLYGLLDMGYTNVQYEKNDVLQISRKGFASSADNSSRWGLTGTEDLGGGMKAEFKIEQGIGTNPRSGISNDPGTRNGAVAGNAYTLDATVLGDRELWVAATYGNTRVQGGFGVTALRNLAVQTDAAGSNLMGNPIAHEMGAYRREGVQVSQTLSAGLVATVAVTGNRQQNGTAAADLYQVGRGYNAALTYAQGPLNVGVAVDEIATKNPTIVANDIPVGSPASALAAADSVLKSTLVAGSYDFGKVKGFAQYYATDLKDNTSFDAIAKGEGKKKAYSVGLQAPMGNLVPFAQIFKGTDSRSNKAATAGEDRAWTGYSVGARYNLSKRTYAYAATGQYKTAAGSDLTNYGDKAVYQQSSVGIAHAF
jgi:predicted porin